MGNIAEKLPSKFQLERASNILFKGLNLPERGYALIIGEELKEGDQPGPNLYTRTNMVRNLRNQIYPNSVPVLFDGNPSELKLFNEISIKLNYLKDLTRGQESEQPITIIHLGGIWDNRESIYEVIQTFNHRINFVDFSGLTTGDCFMMSELDESKLKKISEANQSIDKSFEDNPKGFLQITTRDNRGKEHVLDIAYDNNKVPFSVDSANFDGLHKPNLGKKSEATYLDIPSGERFIKPYLPKRVNGEFSSEGVVFKIKNGILTDFDAEGTVVENLNSSLEQLMARFHLSKKEGSSLYKKHLFFADVLGFGLYQLAGIKSRRNSSGLTYGKSGPHINFAQIPIDEKGAIVDSAPEAIIHAGAILDYPNIRMIDHSKKNIKELFPPLPLPQIFRGI